MAHFIGQIGAETGGLNHLDEDNCYSEKNIRSIFAKRKYCDLFEGYDILSPVSCAGKNKLSGCEPSLSDTRPAVK
jgi:predicted chitinase